MSLQDDIARYIHQGRPRTALQDDIAAGLERDYYLVKLADLPEVTEGYEQGSHYVEGESVVFTSAKNARMWACRDLAVLRHLESRESEVAARQARRDELTAELTGIDGERYNSIGVGTILRKSIDRIIELEAQVSS